MAVIKRQVHADWEDDAGGVEGPRSRGLVEASLDGPDFREGIRSFLRKRPPAFPPLGQGSNIELDPEHGPSAD